VNSIHVLSGHPLSTILRIESMTENQLIETIKQRSIIENLAVSYNTSGGEIVKSKCTILAAADENGNYLGMDFILNNVLTPGMSDPEVKILTHSDVMKAYVEIEMNSRGPLQPRTYTQSYIATQLNVLQIMLARIGGTASRLAFEKIINNKIQSMAAQMNMENGNLNFLRRDLDVQVYRSLLKASTDYAVNVVGKNTVKREMLLVDKYVGHGTLELISQMDLRIFTAE
jgi:hypothetical protein